MQCTNNSPCTKAAPGEKRRKLAWRDWSVLASEGSLLLVFRQTTSRIQYSILAGSHFLPSLVSIVFGLDSIVFPYRSISSLIDRFAIP
ncbi:BQ5605_C023g09601 [Microbotryum silenes-dioicae]|uniref:BQ5605_C023g09601 protein n=1 Tax=Microbotryum silenes-dioicae TaxID=796604 RepID=A0A2X0MPV0_9BASI|nr:BQ5605_C023g09601 [Microbotryum silenes-dioicae]